jgi:hypothetical protein
LGDRRLSLVEGPVGNRDDGYHFGLVIEDIDQTLDALTDAGVDVRTRRNPLLQIMLQDPSGKWIELRQAPEAYQALPPHS